MGNVLQPTAHSASFALVGALTRTRVPGPSHAERVPEHETGTLRPGVMSFPLK